MNSSRALPLRSLTRAISLPLVGGIFAGESAPAAAQSIDLEKPTDRVVRVDGLRTFEELGYSVSVAGDVNGDG